MLTINQYPNSYYADKYNKMANFKGDGCKSNMTIDEIHDKLVEMGDEIEKRRLAEKQAEEARIQAIKDRRKARKDKIVNFIKPTKEKLTKFGKASAKVVAFPFKCALVVLDIASEFAVKFILSPQGVAAALIALPFIFVDKWWPVKNLDLDKIDKEAEKVENMYQNNPDEYFESVGDVMYDYAIAHEQICNESNKVKQKITNTKNKE